MRTIASVVVAILTFANAARADIFQWEYINPADPSQGKRQSTTLAPHGAGVDAVPGAQLYGRNLSMAYLIDADLTNANGFQANLTSADLSQANLTNTSFDGAKLTDADFTGAQIRGAKFGRDNSFGGTGVTLGQLYATESYQVRDLTGIGLWGNNLSGANFAGQNLTAASFLRARLGDANFRAANLTNAILNGATLGNADFTDTEIRGAHFLKVSLGCGPVQCPSLIGSGITLAQLYSTASYQEGDLRGASFDFFLGDVTDNLDFVTDNIILPSGRIAGLDMDDAGLLVVRDYDGRPGNTAYPPISITIDQHLAMAPGGTLRMVFEADAWDSTISFAPGIPVTLGGTLELTFTDDVNPASQLGRTLKIFDWTGVTPTGAFAVSSPYCWDLSNLYTTGEVTFTAIPEPSISVLIAAALAIFPPRRWRRSAKPITTLGYI